MAVNVSDYLTRHNLINYSNFLNVCLFVTYARNPIPTSSTYKHRNFSVYQNSYELNRTNLLTTIIDM